MFLIIVDGYKLIKEEIKHYYKSAIFIIENKTIILSADYYFKDHSYQKELKYGHFEIYSEKDAKRIDLYVYENSKGSNDFKLYEPQDMIVSTNPKSTIVIDDPSFDHYYLYLKGKIIQTNYDKLLINGYHYFQKELTNGDKVEALGFVFYYQDDFFYINSFKNTNHLKPKIIKEKIFKYQYKVPSIHNFYEDDINDLIIPKLKPFICNNKTVDKKLIFQLGPSITMAAGMCALALVNVLNSQSNNILTIIIMPIVVVIASVVWPLISNLNEKHKNNKEYKKAKTDYLTYLRKYESVLLNNLNNYLRIKNFYSFDLNKIDERLFYINKNAKAFLNLSLGLKNEYYELDIKETKDSEIDNYLIKIKESLKLEKLPYFLDLKENKRYTFISKDNSYYLFNLVLLELCSKYHFNDLKIAIFSKDKQIFQEIYNLPHLFFEDKRLCFLKENELLSLNKYKEQTIVLLSLDNINIKFNDNIKVIYFSNSINKILKDVDKVIEFKQKGYINYQREFDYEFKLIDFNYYYNKLSLFLKRKQRANYQSFYSIFKTYNPLLNYQGPQNGLQANFALTNNELLDFDLHESKDGPHGLIGGSTGSGKSEAIVSLLLSLAIKYRADYLNMIIIDYKGGGLKESLSYNGQALPHIVADISNLESENFQRLIERISFECNLRQKLFKELSKESSYSIMNLDDYLLYNTKLPKLAHLLIVVDEFAELKANHPDIIKKLISFSRIGRSLGLHLILATQKPSGSIDEEIWSNAHFKIALKVHSDKDSFDILKSNSAALLTKPGEFILKEDDEEIKAKAIYSKSLIDDKQNYEVKLLDQQLNVISYHKTSNLHSRSEASLYLEQIIKAHNMLNIKVNDFSFIKSKAKTINELSFEYQNNSGLILGEIDDYLRAKRNLAIYSFKEDILIYSNRLNEINNILNQLNASKIEHIIISTNKYVGGYLKDCLAYNQEEELAFLYKTLIHNIQELTIIIEDINALLAYNDNHLNYLYKLLKKENDLRLHFILLTKSSNLNYRLLDCFKNKVAININDEQDLINLFGVKSKYAGKDYIYESEPICFVPNIIEEYRFIKPLVNSYLKKIPTSIKYELTIKGTLLGIDIKNREAVYLKNNEGLIITGLDKELLIKYARLYNQANIKVVYYKNNLNHQQFNFLWVGKGVNRQSIFYLNNSNDSDDYVYYYHQGSVFTLKGVDIDAN